MNNNNSNSEDDELSSVESPANGAKLPDHAATTVQAPPTMSKTGISDRLDHAIKQMRQDSPSSNLVLLSHDFDLMRKDLRDLLDLSKTYKASMISMDEARTEVSCACH